MESTTNYVNISGTTEHFNISSPVGPTKPQWWSTLDAAFRAMMPVILALLMFAMGCDITVSEIWKVLKRPIPVIIGAVCQFVFLPLVTFGLAHAFQMSDLKSLGLIIWACCPGGTTSNVYSYWTRGDLTLSVTMTACSTVAALGFMPLNLFIYTRSWTSHGVAIPYTNILIALVSILIPVAFGMLIRWKKPVWAKKFLVLGTVFGLLGILLVVIMQSVLAPSMYSSGWRVYFSAFILPIVAFLLGFTISKICCMSYKVARTVAFETGAQNIGLGVAVILLSFKSFEAYEMLMMITMISIGITIDGVLTVVLIRLYFKLAGVDQADGNMSCESEEKKTEKRSSEENQKRDKVIKSSVAGINNQTFCSDDGKFSQI